MAKCNQIMRFRHRLEEEIIFSQVVKTNSLIFISGAAAMDENGELKGGASMAEQVRTVFADLTEQLKRLGAKPENVVKETIYTVDVDALVAAAPIRAEFYSDCVGPASSWIEVRRLFNPELLLEVELILEL